MRKKLLFLLLIVAIMVTPLFAGGDSEKAGSKEVKLTLWNSSQTMVEWYDEVVTPAFKEMYPEVTDVEVLYLPIQDFVKKLAVALPSGDVPDIMEIEDSWATPYLTAGYFDPNTPELNRILDQMRPELKNSVTYKGKTYGVPVAPFHELFFYNLDMMAEAGITEIPDTMDEVIQAAVKMTKRDATGKIERSGFSMRLGGNPSGTSQKFWVLGLLPNGVDIWEESKTQPGKYHAGFDNEGGYNALKMYLEMLYKYEVDDFASMKDTEAFAKERTAINMREPSAAVSIERQGPNVNWVAAPMPVGNVRRATFLITLNLYVPKDSPKANKDLARKYIELATSEKMQDNNAINRAGFHPYTSVDPASFVQDRLKPGFAMPDDMHVITVPVHNAYDMAMVKLGEALPNILKKAELVNDPEGIKREVAYLASLVNDAYAEFDEYAE